MKERLFFSPKGDQRVEVCNCDGELQLRLFGQPWTQGIWAVASVVPALVRVKLTPGDLRRLADFFTDLAEQEDDPS